MDPSDRPRFAIYFAPGDDDPLWQLGTSWLGRDARSGFEAAQPEVPGVFSPERFADLTAAPRTYGFHATLKAPFFLKKGCSFNALEERCEKFGSELERVRAPGLRVGELGGFLALVTGNRSPGIHHLAAACVESFDDLRAPLTPEELKKRRQSALTEQQSALLDRWGYSYVMEEFRFHMTLSKRLEDAEREGLAGLARSHFGASLEADLVIDAISLFAQPDMRSPFRELSRFSLTG